MNTHRAPATGDLTEEALAILGESGARELTVRLTGGVAVSLLCPSARRTPLQRRCKDIDLVGVGSQRKALARLLEDRGYSPNEEVNLYHGRDRLLYYAPSGYELDVFFNRFVMCHELDLRDRLTLEEQTLASTDLLLTKLQVMETNERDLKDAIALCIDCDVELARVARLLAADWGWWRTVTEVLDRVEAYAAQLDGFEHRPLLEERTAALRRAIEDEPKTLRWKARARVGDRVRWYQLPEEV